MARRIRPAKPMAVLSALSGAAIVTFGIVVALTSDEGPPLAFMVMWVVIGLGVIGFNLWAAFGRGGHIYSVEEDR